MKNALKEQVGGSHYKDSPIQPVEYSHANKLGFIEGSVVKYVSRHRQKNGRQDIEKAIHLLKILLDLEYPNEVSQSSTTDYLGVKEVPIETKGNGLLDGVSKPMSICELRRIINNPNKGDGLELHINHLWEERNYDSIFKITGLSYPLINDLVEERSQDKVSQGTELSGVISSSGSVIATTVDPKVFYHQQSTK